MKNTNDYQPKDIEEMRAVEEIKTKGRTSLFAMVTLFICLALLGIAFIVDIVSAANGTRIEISNSPLLTIIASIGSSCLTYLFMKKRDN